MDTPEAKAFLDAFKARYHAVPVSVWAVLAGDAFRAIVGALDAGQDKPEAMAAWLKQLRACRPFPARWALTPRATGWASFTVCTKVDDKAALCCSPNSHRRLSAVGAVVRAPVHRGLATSSAGPGPTPPSRAPLAVRRAAGRTQKTWNNSYNSF